MSACGWVPARQRVSVPVRRPESDPAKSRAPVPTDALPRRRGRPPSHRPRRQGRNSSGATTGAPNRRGSAIGSCCRLRRRPARPPANAEPKRRPDLQRQFPPRCPDRGARSGNAPLPGLRFPPRSPGKPGRPPRPSAVGIRAAALHPRPTTLLRTKPQNRRFPLRQGTSTPPRRPFDDTAMPADQQPRTSCGTRDHTPDAAEVQPVGHGRITAGQLTMRISCRPRAGDRASLWPSSFVVLIRGRTPRTPR